MFGSLEGATTERRALPRREAQQLQELWVFDDDPTLRREGVSKALIHATRHYAVHRMDADAREAALIEASVGRRGVPGAVLCGPSHVLDEDPHVRFLSGHPDIHLVLVTDGVQPELFERACEQFHIDGWLALPFGGEDLVLHLEHLARPLEPDSQGTPLRLEEAITLLGRHLPRRRKR